MTIEEIDKLEAGRTLDALIAEKVLGQPLLCRLIGDGVSEPMRMDVPHAVWRERSPADRHWETWSPDGAERVINEFGVRFYSTDMNAAALVIEQLDGITGGVRLETTNFTRRGCFVSFRVPIKGFIAGWRHVVTEADTFPLAICRAALKALNTVESRIEAALENFGEKETKADRLIHAALMEEVESGGRDAEC